MSTSREDRIFYQSLGICPICKKNRLMGSEKNCPECRAYHVEAVARFRDKHRLERNEQEREYKKVRYKALKENGICPICGKRKPMAGRVLCGICNNKINTRYKRRKKEGVA